MLTKSQWYTFRDMWMAGKFPNQRYGQAFINYAAVECNIQIQNSDLFNSTNNHESHMAMYDFVDWEK